LLLQGIYGHPPKSVASPALTQLVPLVGGVALSEINNNSNNNHNSEGEAIPHQQPHSIASDREFPLLTLHSMDHCFANNSSNEWHITAKIKNTTG
jgi:hypothetical protein